MVEPRCLVFPMGSPNELRTRSSCAQIVGVPTTKGLSEVVSPATQPPSPGHALRQVPLPLVMLGQVGMLGQTSGAANPGSQPRATQGASVLHVDDAQSVVRHPS